MFCMWLITHNMDQLHSYKLKLKDVFEVPLTQRMELVNSNTSLISRVQEPGRVRHSYIYVLLSKSSPVTIACLRHHTAPSAPTVSNALITIVRVSSSYFPLKFESIRKVSVFQPMYTSFPLLHIFEVAISSLSWYETFQHLHLVSYYLQSFSVKEEKGATENDRIVLLRMITNYIIISLKFFYI